MAAASQQEAMTQLHTVGYDNSFSQWIIAKASHSGLWQQLTQWTMAATSQQEAMMAASHRNSFHLDGSHYGNWWANVTTTRYETIRNCAKDVQNGFSLGSFTDPYTQLTVTPNISRFADQYVPELLADSSGLRLAYKAYKTRERGMGKEHMPAGFPDLNIDQMFFISFAQANCQNTPDIMKFNQLYENRYPSKAKVNLAVSQVPEFAKAFKCRPGQAMYAAKTCTLF
ncbi:endothelin-converting enzyme 1-like [Plakobranchus ocellatus]|uniref:Endothelin-converting enzyme 1-like n=1 Tax=Plakobranchus ocellatus TaxID=259542 RepID=A0AAV3ZYF6_9GAST|nr:endothelin-converting enzyme 1-like [Plakobranchus ocellatus]